MTTTVNPGKGGKGGSKKRGGGAAVVVVEKKSLPEGVTQSGEDDREYKFEIAGQTIKFNVEEGLESLFSLNLSRDDKTVDFSVGGIMLAKGQLQGRDAIKATLKIRKIMEYDASTRPDGFKYNTRAQTGDSRQNSRAALYNTVGFSRPVGGIVGKTQYAIVKDGKLVPDNKRLLSTEKEAGVKKSQAEKRWQETLKGRNDERRIAAQK